VDARLLQVEKQIEAVWVKLGKVDENTSEIKATLQRLDTRLDSLPERVLSLEESRARGRGVIAAASVAAGLCGSFITRLFP
jgi:septal ring factor EnvC (AmiA/AmiB activator)